MKIDNHVHLAGNRRTHCDHERSQGGGRSSAPGSTWRPLTALLMAFSLTGITACGGGGGGSAGTGISPPTDMPPQASTSAEGIWYGTGLDGRVLKALVLDSGEYFVIYSAAGNPSVTAGLVQGTGKYSSTQFSSSDAIDFNFEGAGASRGALEAAVDYQASLIGTVTFDTDPASARSFAFTYNNPVPVLAILEGNYDTVLDGDTGTEYFRMLVSDAGEIDVTGSSGCHASGTLRQRAPGHAYGIELTFGSSPCALPGQSLSGAGFLDHQPGGILQLGLVDSTREHGFVLSGSRDVGIELDYDGDGIVNSEDTDDDNDGVADLYDRCPVDTNPNCPDTILADGREWLQPSLFTGLAWNAINDVCPAENSGVCDGTLSGRDMNGWTWASATELRVLFEFYGFQAPSPEFAAEWKLAPGQLIIANDNAASWHGAGWLPTSIGCPFECVYGYGGYTRDSFSVGVDAPLTGRIGLVSSGYPVLPDGYYVAANPQAEYSLPPNLGSDGVGGWFYRTP